MQPFPATGARYQIPVVGTAGYRHPLWSPAGDELFYIIGGNVRLMVSGVVTRPAFAFANAAALVPKPPAWLDSFEDVARSYDITPDGQHFIARITGDSAAQFDVGRRRQIQVVLNWMEELKQRVPVK